MCALSNRIREKPDWWEKVKDETIFERWREEALQQAEDRERPVWNLTPAMVRPALHLIAAASTLNPIFQGKVRASGASRIRGLA